MTQLLHFTWNLAKFGHLEFVSNTDIFDWVHTSGVLLVCSGFSICGFHV